MKCMCAPGLLVGLVVLVVGPMTLSAPTSWALRLRSHGPDGVWNKLHSLDGVGFESPPTGVVYDPSRNQLVRFTQDWVSFENVDPNRQGRVVMARLAPASSVEYSAIHDPLRDRIVLLTLDSSAANFTIGTFALSLHEPIRWSRLVTHGASPNLSYASGIYDPRGDRMIVYGGMDVSGSGREACGEVWALSLGKRSRWTRVETQGVEPPARMDHTAIYDAAHAAMVVYGGKTALQGAVLGDAWSLDLAPRPRWRQVSVRGDVPASRTRHAAIYDAGHARMIVTGGWSAWHHLSGQAYEDVWALTLREAPQWRRLTPRGDAPLKFANFRTFADASRDRMILTDERGAELWALDWSGARTSKPGDVQIEPTATGNSQPVRADWLSLRIVPARVDPLVARVTLPQAGGAQLDLLDVSGRRIWSSSVNASAGAHDVAIAPESRLSNGVYFLRLEQAGQTRAVKFVTVR